MVAEIEGYRPADSECWVGRTDASGPRDALRWHQVVRTIDLRKAVEASRAPFGICFVGYGCDEGVARNLGRRGAAGGPRDIRKALANLPVTFSDEIELADAGDIGCARTVESTQLALAEAVSRICRTGLMPVVLGGGHDLEYGHWLGIRQSVEEVENLGIVSFDAHFDLRPHDDGANSGTSFSQIAETCEREGTNLHYLCLGIQRTSNTVRLFRRAEELGVEYVLARDLVEGRLDEARVRIDGFIDGLDGVVVSVDADVLSSACAPGVSAPQPLGLQPDVVLRLLEHVLDSGKATSIDVAEVSPRFDDDGRTARAAAVFLHAAMECLTPQAARIDQQER